MEHVKVKVSYHNVIIILESFLGVTMRHATLY